MRRNVCTVLFISFLVFLFASCNDVLNNNSAASEYGEIALELPSVGETTSARAAQTESYTYKISFKHSSGDISVIEGKSGSKVTFSGALTGKYEIAAQAFDSDGLVVQECFGQALVEKEKVSNITLEPKKIIKILSYSNDIEKLVESFKKSHPDFAFEIKSTVAEKSDNSSTHSDSSASPSSIEQYEKNLETEFASPNAFSPDIFVTNLGFAKKYSQVSVNQNDELQGLCYDTEYGAFIYRRSVAQKVFGTSDASEIAQIIGSSSGSWENFKAAAANCTLNGVSIVSDINDVWHAVCNSADHGWIGFSNMLFIDSKREEFFDFAKFLSEKIYTEDSDSEKETKQVLGFFASPNFAVNLISEKYNNSFNDWAIVASPVESVWGGSYLNVNKNLAKFKNESVKELIKWFAAESKKASASEAFEGGKLYEEACKKIETSDADIITEYDNAINELWLSEVRAYINGEKSREVALNDFMMNVHNSVGLAVSLPETGIHKEDEVIKAITFSDGVKFEVKLPQNFDFKNNSLWITEIDSGVSVFPEKNLFEIAEKESSKLASDSERKIILYYPLTEKNLVYRFDLHIINNGVSTVVPVYATAGGGKSYLKWSSDYAKSDNLNVEIEKPYKNGMPTDKRMGVIRLKKNLSGYFNFGKEIAETQLEYAVSSSKEMNEAVFDGYILNQNVVAFSKISDLLNGKTFEYNENPSAENPYYFASVAVRFKINGFSNQFFRIAPLNSAVYDYKAN